MAREAYGVFEGGGVKGIALVGALKAAEELGFTFRAVAGTSAGAIVASLVAAGYTADELRLILMEKDFKDFMDPVASGFTGWIPWANLASAWNAMGLYKGDHFHNWMREKLSLKIFDNKRKSPVFNDFLGEIGAQLEVVAIELISQEIRTFERYRNANLPVADVVRLSLSIPFFLFLIGSELKCMLMIASSVTSQPGVLKMCKRLNLDSCQFWAFALKLTNQPKSPAP